jgi:hypothetical protein
MLIISVAVGFSRSLDRIRQAEKVIYDDLRTETDLVLGFEVLIEVVTGHNAV